MLEKPKSSENKGLFIKLTPEGGTRDFKKLECDLWERTREQMKNTLFFDVKALLIGFSDHDLYMMRSQLKNIGVKFVASMPAFKHEQEISPIKNIFTHVFINFDAFEDVDSGVDALLKAREDNINLVIILLSNEISADDFDMNRALICDASLKLPLTENRLRSGLIYATSNNNEFRNTLSEKALLSNDSVLSSP